MIVVASPKSHVYEAMLPPEELASNVTVQGATLQNVLSIRNGLAAVPVPGVEILSGPTSKSHVVEVVTLKSEALPVLPSGLVTVTERVPVEALVAITIEAKSVLEFPKSMLVIEIPSPMNTVAPGWKF